MLTERKCGDIVKRKLWFSLTVFSKTTGARDKKILVNTVFISPVSYSQSLALNKAKQNHSPKTATNQAAHL